MSVFAWGCGRYGQLGNGLLDNKALPVKMDLSLLATKEEEVPMHVVCGSHCTFVITSKQNVYVCGMGRYGRLGVGTQKDHTFPVPVQLPGHILNLSSRFTHSSSVDTSGQVSELFVCLFYDPQTLMPFILLVILLGIDPRSVLPCHRCRFGCGRSE